MIAIDARNCHAARRLAPLLVAALLLAGGCGRGEPPAFNWDFARLDPTGEVLAEEAAGPHDCVLDRRTGLWWEVKRAGSGLQDPGYTYTWYSPDGATNGGEPGAPGGGRCELDACDTLSYVAAVNAAGLCGRSDWRVPSRDELLTLVDPARIGQGAALDPYYFPSTAAAEYWTATTFSLYPQGAWAIDTVYGQDRVDWKTEAKHLLLVNGPTTAVKPKRRR